MNQVLWSASVHSDDGRWRGARLMRQPDGLLVFEVGPDGEWPQERVGIDRDDVRSLFHALGDALQAGA